MSSKLQHCEYFLGIDIGSYETKVVLAKVTSWEGYTLEIIDAVSCITNKLVERSSIINIEKLSETLAEVIHPLLEPLGNVYVYTVFSMKNKFIQSKINKGQNPFSKRIREVNEQDLLTARLMASNALIDNGREYINAVLRQYRVDGRSPRKNPIGDLGSNVEAELLLVSTSIEEMNKFKKCAQKIHVNVDLFCASSLATGMYMLTDDEKNQGAVLLDIGDQGIAASLFEHGSPKSVVVVPHGLSDISKDISKELHISAELAKTVMVKYSCLDPIYLSEFSDQEEVRSEDGMIKKIDPEYIYKISFARALEILQLVYQALHLKEHIDEYSVIITGGGARVRGIVSMVEKLTASRVRLAQPSNWGGPIQVYRSPNYGVAIGLCVSGFHQYYQNRIIGREHVPLSANRAIKHVEKRRKGWGWFNKLSNKFKKFFSLGEID